MNFSTFTAACLLLATVPQSDGVLRDEVDLLEVNNFCDSEGKRVFRQLIVYEWSSEKGRHEVQAWRLMKRLDMQPDRDYATGDYVLRWLDGDSLRELRAKAWRETWTNHDPELTEREHLAKERRKELSISKPWRMPR